MSKKTTSSLVVLNSRELTYSQEQLPKVQAAAIEMIARVRQLEREGAARAILAGLALHRVKASLKFGTFMPWIKNNIKGCGRSQVNYYMRLASVFVEKAGVSKPDLLALPGDQVQLALDGGNEEARDFFEKLSKFVGDRSLTELLEKHGLKNVPKLGGKQESEDSDENEDNPPQDAESLRLQSMDEISSALERSRALLIKENRLQHFIGHPEKVQAIVKGFRELADELERAAKPLLTTKA